MRSSSWYENLNKPSWAPDSSLFGTVWSILYPIIFIVNGYILVLLTSGKISLKTALPFWINLFFNFLFTPLQFGLRNNLLASIDILLVLVTIIWAMVAIWPYSKAVTLAFVPYLIWVSIATTLQIYITINN